MREILLTSSVLILALLALRRAFRQKISRRVQYALWGLVLVRLLAPVSLPAADFSVLTVAEPVRASVSARLEAVPAFTGPVTPVFDAQPQQSRYPAAVEPVIPGETSAAQPSAVPVEDTSFTAKKSLTLAEMLTIVWLAGAAVMAVWLLASNLRFVAMLRRRRVPLDIPGCKRRVYLVESGLASPCLFGVLQPAIYLTPAAAANEESLRHVLAHEETHARHLDPLWALLRSVCLAVYWFDPLVWIAASAAKTDCELACDEGAVRSLGEEERLAYGRTLLRLIPVRRLPGNPLLSATTMSSDKKRLRDRISRIAEKRETKKLALCAMALLTAVTCLATFAGRAEGTERQDGPLTAAELRFFNEQFFNGDYLNINNQFLSSIYEYPEDIDIFNLVYCGVPGEYGRDAGMPQPDRETILREVYGGEAPDCAEYSVNTATLDALLTDKMGLTLAETKKTGLENFTYLPEYDTYYWAHGDTNYRVNVTIFTGAREGDLIHLYYDETALDSICTCVTLRETEDGYQFVSNAFREKPIIPTIFPEGEPLAAIPLTDLTVYEPEKVEVTRHSGDCAERFIYQGHWLLASGERIQAYRSTDGNIYIAQIIDETPDGGWEADCFAVMPGEDFTIEPFALGGFAVSGYSEAAGTVLTDYYYFETDGSLRRLVQVPGGIENVRIIDLDGDGTNELLATNGFGGAGLVFRRDGRLYNADIAALTARAPDDSVDFFGGIDPYARCLNVYTFSQEEDGGQSGAVLTRCIYFDGENLLVYRPDVSAADHAVEDAPDAGPPALTPAQEVQDLLDRIMQNDKVVLEVWTPEPDGNGGWMLWQDGWGLERHTASPDEGNGRNRQRYFTDPDTFSWSEAGELPPAGDPAPNAEVLMISTLDAHLSLIFFSGSELVRYEDQDAEAMSRRFRAKNLTDPADPFYDRSDIFNFMRQWFDETEGAGRDIVIPDDGRSREELALVWAQSYEGGMLELTETNRFHCSYVDVRDVEIDTEFPRELYPDDIGGREAFLFSYSVVFVPDDWRYHMAGNTEEYQGDDAPEGAFQYWRFVYLYLDEDGWHGDGPGTGP